MARINPPFVLSGGTTGTIPVKASAAEINTGTDNAKFATAAAIAGSTILKSTTTRFQTGVLTRAQDGANANVATTGVGFTPSAILFFSGGPDVDSKSFGGSTGSGSANNTCVWSTISGGFASVSSAWCIYSGDGVSWNQSAIIASFDADGFTLAWNKGGTPSAGNMLIFYIAFR